MKTFFKIVLLAFIGLYSLSVFFGDDDLSEENIRIPEKPSASSGIYVQDYAGVISPPVRKYLQNVGQQLDRRTTAQLVVVTVKSLDGAPLEDYSLKILRTWGIGNKEKNNGVLMLVSTGDRKSRIEVGYGLEGKLTDSFTGKIQDRYMIPSFRKGNYEEGIAKGYEVLAQSIASEYNVRLAVSGYANHSPGTVKAGAGGQSTDDLFNKALAEQNGTEYAPANTAPEETARQENTSSDGGSESASVSEKKPEGIIDTVFWYAESLFDTYGWLVIVLAFVALDGIFFGGMFTGFLFKILLFFFSGGGGSGGGSGGGGFGGSFGGGSGGGGGSSRSW